MKKNKNMGINKFIRSSIYLSVAFIFIATASCKKYPDGPLFSIHTIRHRLAGTWDVEYFSINGYDSTSYLKSKYFYGMYEFLEKHSSDFCGYMANTLGYSSRGNWVLLDKTTLEIGLLNDFLSPEHIGPYRAEKAIWKIRRLTEKEMWLKNTYTDGRDYLVKFKLFKNN